ncbi:MAG: sensor histidine kinase [Curtobacterium sp.]
MTRAPVRWLPAAGVLLLGVGGVAAELAGGAGAVPLAAGAYAAAVAVAALTLLAHRPVVATAGVLGVCLVYHLAGYPGQAPAVALFVTLAMIAARPPVSRALATAWCAALIWTVIPTLPPRGIAWAGWAVLGPAVAMWAAAAVGAVVGVSGRQARAELAVESAELRADVARDVHDVLAHTIAAITVQTNLALDAVEDDPATARAAMRRVQDLARSASPQLRHSLLQLRADGRPVPPQPTFAVLDAALQEARLAGFRIERRFDPGGRAIDPVAEAVLARIGQEAITNAVRHSGGRTIRCSVSDGEDGLRLEVQDDGVHAPGAPGLGLAGMRERAAAVGARLDLGPADGGGFAVHVLVPHGAERTLR